MPTSNAYVDIILNVTATSLVIDSLLSNLSCTRFPPPLLTFAKLDNVNQCDSIPFTSQDYLKTNLNLIQAGQVPIYACGDSGVTNPVCNTTDLTQPRACHCVGDYCNVPMYTWVNWYTAELQTMKLFSRRWSLVSAQLSIKFGCCPSCTVSIVLYFHNTTDYHFTSP